MDDGRDYRLGRRSPRVSGLLVEKPGKQPRSLLMKKPARFILMWHNGAYGKTPGETRF